MSGRKVAMRRSKRLRSKDVVIINDANENAQSPVAGYIDLTRDFQPQTTLVDLTIASSPAFSPILIESTPTNCRSHHRKRAAGQFNRIGSPPLHRRRVDDNSSNDARVSVFDRGNDEVILVEDQAAKGLPVIPSTSPKPSCSTVRSPGKLTFSCPVCLESANTICKSGQSLYSTICGHIFCKNCIYGAIKAQKKCPTCRKKLKMCQVHPIYI